jgi:ATP-dependent 26S proteasome regulatory subunit
MTAMDVAALPPALVRSGRIELWLEMKLPDADARRRILERDVRNLPTELQTDDLAEAVNATDGFAGADLRRVTQDAKLAYASDRAQGKATRAPEEYLRVAVAGVHANRERYAEAEAAARAKREAKDQMKRLTGQM